jgi:hypothetical protein
MRVVRARRRYEVINGMESFRRRVKRKEGSELKVNMPTRQVFDVSEAWGKSEQEHAGSR